MANTRELSQLASLISVNDDTKSISVISNLPDAKLGIGTTNPGARIDVSGDVNVSGVVTATSFSGTATTTTNIPNLTGDITSVNTATALATVNSNVGQFGSQTLIPVVTVNAKGLVTAVSTANAVTVNLDDNISLTSVVASGIVTATQFVTGASGSAIGINTNTISGPATLTIDPAAVGDDTGTVVIKGNLQIDGTTTTIKSTTITVVDKNIVLGFGAINDAAADGSGISIVSGVGNKTFQFEDAGDNLGSSENLNVASGKVYKINNTEVLSATTLGSGVVNSSLTSVGTLGQLNVSGVSTFGNTVVGGGTTQLIVTGNARVTGIITVGTSSITLDGVNNRIVVGSGLTITESGITIGPTTINSSGSLSGTSGTITTFNSTNGTITNLTGTAGTITTFNSTVGSITKLTSTNINASGISTVGSLSIGATSVISSARQLQNIVSLDATTTATVESVVVNVALPKAGGIMTGDITLNAQSDLRFADTDSSNWVAFQAPATIAANVTWTLPATDASVSGYALKSDGSGQLSWGLAGGAVGTGTDQIFYENDQTITGNYSITAGKNAITAGPVAINSGVSVTVPSGSYWSIV